MNKCKNKGVSMIETKRLILRDFNERDYDFYHKIETSPFTIFHESDFVPSDEMTMQQFKSILELKSDSQRKKWSFIIDLKETQQSIGRIVIWQINDEIDEWEMGWYLDQSFTGFGYMIEAASKLIDFAFLELRAHRIQALCNETNIKSENVMKRIGMKKEGTLRSIRKLKGSWTNMHIYSILDIEHQIYEK